MCLLSPHKHCASFKTSIDLVASKQDEKRKAQKIAQAINLPCNRLVPSASSASVSRHAGPFDDVFSASKRDRVLLVLITFAGSFGGSKKRFKQKQKAEVWRDVKKVTEIFLFRWRHAHDLLVVVSDLLSLRLSLRLRASKTIRNIWISHCAGAPSNWYFESIHSGLMFWWESD